MNLKNDIFEVTLIILLFILLGGLYGAIEFKSFTLIQIFQGLSGFLAIYLLYLRFKITDDMKIQQDKHFTQDNRFRSFLEATKMLTDKDATIEAKISALYLLYDVAKDHPEDTERILQVLNKQIAPLIEVIEGKKDNFDIKLKSLNEKRIIIEWIYKGNDTEKILSNSLSIIKKIALLDGQKYLELDNTLIFDLDITYQEKYIMNIYNGIKNKNEPTKNLIFFHCNLENIDFTNLTFHYCKFINCNLDSTNFKEANLWGTVFINSNIQNTNFFEAECEGIEFRECFNLEKEQVNNMNFLNLDESSKKALIILSNKNELESLDCFRSEDEYKEWKLDIRTR